MAINDLRNQYLDTLGARFDKTPKSVWAALAFAFAMRLCEDDQDLALKMLHTEWTALNANGIVPQKPFKEVR